MSRNIELHSLLDSERFKFASLRGQEALSPAPGLDLKQLPGTDVTVEIETATGVNPLLQRASHSVRLCRPRQQCGKSVQVPHYPAQLARARRVFARPRKPALP